MLVSSAVAAGARAAQSAAAAAARAEARAAPRARCRQGALPVRRRHSSPRRCSSLPVRGEQRREGRGGRGGAARPGRRGEGRGGGEVVPIYCVSGWVGGVGVVCRVPQIWAHGKQFIVCFLLDTRQTVRLPCARKIAHGKSLDTR